MKVVGLTGKYCAGKSSIAAILKERGLIEIDVDALGHSALERCSDELQKTFSPDMIGTDGKIDRKRLASLVFSDEIKLRTLESIVHPRMVQDVKARIAEEEQRGTAAVVVNAALLRRMHLDDLCDTVCFVSVPLLLRFFRAKRRDRATLRSFLNVEKSQRDISVVDDSSAGSDFILRNVGRKSFIHRQVDDLCISIGI